MKSDCVHLHMIQPKLFPHLGFIGGCEDTICLFTVGVIPHRKFHFLLNSSPMIRD